MTAERKSKTDESEIKAMEEDAINIEESIKLEEPPHPTPAEAQADVQSEAGERQAEIDRKEKKQEKQSKILSNIAKTMSLQYGEDSVVLLKDNPEKATVTSWISTGNYAINWVCSGKTIGGGLPIGRIVEFFGDPSSGKSLLLAHLFSEAQKRDDTITALFDTEATFSSKFAKNIGLNPDKMLYTKAYRKETKKVKIINNAGKLETIEMEVVVGPSIERVTEMVDGLIDLTHYQAPEKTLVIGLDSAAICTSEHELEEPDKRDLTKAQQWRSFVRKLESKISELNVLLIVTNHVIANIDMNPWSRKVGTKMDKITPGGSGLPFGSSLRLDLTRGKDLKEDDEDKKGPIIGHEIWCFIFKNKVYIPRRRSVVKMFFNSGLDACSGLMEILAAHNIVEDVGSATYRYAGKRFKRDKMDKYPGLSEMIAEYPEILTKLDELS